MKLIGTMQNIHCLLFITPQKLINPQHENRDETRLNQYKKYVILY